MENSPEEKKSFKRKTAKPLLLIAMVSISMLFAGLTSAYIVTQPDNFWVNFNLPQMFYISTAIILISSASLNWALRAAGKNNFKNVTKAVAATLLLGLSFMASQYMGWSDLVDQGHFFVGDISQIKGEYGVDYTIDYNNRELLYNNGNYYMPDDAGMKEPINENMFKSFHSSSSFLYVLSGLHVAHVLGGVIVMIVVFGKALRQKFDAENLLGLQLCSTYWHFLDGLWVYLFLFLLFIQ